MNGNAFMLYKIAGAIFTPPGLLVTLLFLLALSAFRKPRRPMLGLLLLLLASITYLGSTTVGARLVLGPLEAPWRREAPPEDRKWAILVLSGGVQILEGGSADIDLYTLGRVESAWRLAQSHDYPLIMSGGELLESADAPPVSTLMADRLRAWGCEKPIYEESASRTTWENLAEVRKMLASPDIDANGVILVTDAFHMTRSMTTAGKFLTLPVHPWPSNYLIDRRETEWHDWLPGSGALHKTLLGIRERLGIWGYGFWSLFAERRES